MKEMTLLQFTIPTIISTQCALVASIAILRIRKVKNKLENVVISFICFSVALWSFNFYFYNISWKFGKAVSLLVIASTLYYAYMILDYRYKKFSNIMLTTSLAALLALLFVPSMSFITYSYVFSIIVFSQVVFVNIMLYKNYRKYKTKFLILVSIMGSVMIVSGFFDMLKVLHSWPILNLSSIGSLAFASAALYLVVDRGFLNTKGWTDYAIELRHKEALIEERYHLLKKANINSIIILTQTIEAKDPYTRGHCLRVRDFSKAIGESIGINKDLILFLEFGALLHDIGKILIPGKILNKDGSLTDEEFAIIKKHPEIGASIMNNVDYFNPVIPMIRNHHERFDGKGYPDGLSGKDIPLEARILAVADTYDAMTSDRPYRKAIELDRALDIMIKVAGSQLDPDLVNTFISKKIYQIPHSDREKVIFNL